MGVGAKDGAADPRPERKPPVIDTRPEMTAPVVKQTRQLICLAPPAGARVARKTTGPDQIDLRQLFGGVADVDPAIRLTSSVDGAALTQSLATNAQIFDIRLRIIYTVDASGLVDGHPAPSQASLLPMMTALVDGMRQDWAGTGLNFLFLPDCDFEIRIDSRLNNDFTLTAAQRALFPAQAASLTQEQVSAMIGAAGNDAHRKQVAAERPNSLLLLICEPNTIVLQNGQWIYVPHTGGSWSSGEADYCVLNKWDFAGSAAANRAGASRAAHEIGHFFHLWHTHRETDNLHAEPIVPVLGNPTPANRLARWQNAIANWIDTSVAPGTSPSAARAVYDSDRGGAVFDTPADPGSGLLGLANLVANGGDAMGPLASVSVTTQNAGIVSFTPDRRNVMSYFLDGTDTNPMHFSDGQIAVMRGALTNGNRKRLVAAQLAETAEPNVRLAAVWSPSTKNQGVGWAASLAVHQQRHNDWTAGGLHMVSQRAYVQGGAVVFDGVWNEGARSQSIMWGWLDLDVMPEVFKKAAAGWRVAAIQAYRHPGTGLRYNAIFEPGPNTQLVMINRTEAEIHQAWATYMPTGMRIRHLDSAIDDKGITRYSLVMEPGSQIQRFITGSPLEQLDPEYTKEQLAGRRLRSLSMVWTANGPRYTAVFDAENASQVVWWMHVRERIKELYDSMWCQGYRLRSLDTVAF